jgi:hypothetical protein
MNSAGRLGQVLTQDAGKPLTPQQIADLIKNGALTPGDLAPLLAQPQLATYTNCDDGQNRSNGLPDTNNSNAASSSDKGTPSNGGGSSNEDNNSSSNQGNSANFTIQELEDRVQNYSVKDKTTGYFKDAKTGAVYRFTSGGKTILENGEPRPDDALIKDAEDTVWTVYEKQPYKATDVEQKAAAMMRIRGIEDADLVIDHPNGPCTAVNGTGCAQVLDDVLPQGAKLTVHYPGGPNGQFITQVFIGNGEYDSLLQDELAQQQGPSPNLTDVLKKLFPN